MNKNLSILLIVMIATILSCATKIDKDDLVASPYETTPVYGFKVSGLNRIDIVDRKFTNFKDCLGLKDSEIKNYTNYKIVIVPSNFKCRYHWISCNGEIDSSRSLILVTEKGLGEGVLEHEWGHNAGLITKNDKYKKDFKHCFPD